MSAAVPSFPKSITVLDTAASTGGFTSDAFSIPDNAIGLFIQTVRTNADPAIVARLTKFLQMENLETPGGFRTWCSFTQTDMQGATSPSYGGVTYPANLIPGSYSGQSVVSTNEITLPSFGRMRVLIQNDDAVSLAVRTRIGWYYR